MLQGSAAARDQVRYCAPVVLMWGARGGVAGAVGGADGFGGGGGSRCSSQVRKVRVPCSYCDGGCREAAGESLRCMGPNMCRTLGVGGGPMGIGHGVRLLAACS